MVELVVVVVEIGCKVSVTVVDVLVADVVSVV